MPPRCQLFMNRSSLSAKPHQRIARSEARWLRPGEIQMSCNRFLAARGLRLEFNQPVDSSDISPAGFDERFHRW